MRSYSARLEKLAAVIQPRTPNFVWGTMDYDERGQASEFQIVGRIFKPLPGETEEELCKRRMAETGNADFNLIRIQLVRALNGRPAPGFERFAK